MLYHGPSLIVYSHASGFSESSRMACLALTAAIIAFFAGYQLAAFFIPPAQMGDRLRKSIFIDSRCSILYLNLAVLVIVLVVVINFLAFGVGNRVLEGLTITYRDIASGLYRELRRENIVGAGAGIFGTLFTYLCRLGPGPFLSFFLIARARAKPTRKRVLIAVGFALLIILTKFSSLSKSDVAIYLLQVAILWFFTAQTAPKINWRVIPLFLCVSLPLVLCYFLFTTTRSFSTVVNLIWERMTIVPNFCLVKHFQYYPNVFDHTHGFNIRLVHNLFYPANTFEPAHARLADGGGNANCVYLADAWVDFSWFGVVMASVIVGFLLRGLDNRLGNKRTTIKAALFVALLHPVHSLVSTSLITCCFGFGLLTLPLLAYVLEKSGHAASSTSYTRRSQFIQKGRYAASSY
jgi:hypothetical protein